MPDLESVISASIQGIESTDSSSDTGSVDATDSAESVASTTDEGSTTESTGQEHTEQAPAPKQRRGPIPFERHESIIANARAERQAEFDALQQKLEAVSWANNPEAQAKVQAFDIIDNDPERFAKALLTDERYQQIFQRHFGQQAAAPQAQAAAPAKAGAARTPRPGPDRLEADGSVSYSEEGLEKLLQWQSEQTSAHLEEKFQKLLEEKFGQVEPVVTEHKARNEWNQRLETQRGVLERARQTWHGFRDHEVAMRDWMGQPGNERATLDEAYRAIVIPALQADRDKMRASIFEELNAKPAAAQVRPPKNETITPPQGDGPRDMEDVIREAIKGLST